MFLFHVTFTSGRTEHVWLPGTITQGQGLAYLRAIGGPVRQSKLVGRQ